MDAYYMETSKRQQKNAREVCKTPSSQACQKLSEAYFKDKFALNEKGEVKAAGLNEGEIHPSLNLLLLLQSNEADQLFTRAIPPSDFEKSLGAGGTILAKIVEALAQGDSLGRSAGLGGTTRNGTNQQPKTPGQSNAANSGGKGAGATGNVVKDVPDGVPYFRVQGGGEGNATSRNALTLNGDGSVSITPGCTGSICVSVGNSDHAAYYLSNKRPDGKVVVFEVDRATHNQIMENAVGQFGNSGAGVKITDVSTPGTSIELNQAYANIMANGSSKGRILTQQEFFNEFGRR